MSHVTDAIHQHHQALLTTLTGQVAAIVDGTPEADPQALVAFLAGDLLPHAIGEERHMYPAIDPLVKAYGHPTATMRVDHEFIADYIRQIQETTAALQAGDPATQPALQTRLQRLCLQLEAVLQLHLEKEERIYVPLFEHHLSEERQQEILDAMHEEPVPPPVAHPDTLDVRMLLPALREERIQAAFAALEAGESFLLVSDHDTRPLYYAFQAEHPGQFTWDELELGPSIWCVRIGRPGAAEIGIDPEQIILVR